jgi:hypothetical protein
MPLDSSVSTVIRLRDRRWENCCRVETGAEISLLSEDPMPAHEVLSYTLTDKYSQSTCPIRHVIKLLNENNLTNSTRTAQ